VICEAKRIRSHYFPWLQERPSELCTPAGRMAGLIPTLSIAATMQICRTDCPASPQPPAEPRARGRTTTTLVTVQGVRRKTQGVKVTNVFNEFRISGTTRCASAWAASRTSGAIERSFLIPDPRSLSPATSMMRLCPSIHTFSHERIPSGHSGERAITSRPLVPKWTHLRVEPLGSHAEQITRPRSSTWQPTCLLRRAHGFFSRQ
jgi:hypothetical protein